MAGSGEMFRFQFAANRPALLLRLRRTCRLEDPSNESVRQLNVACNVGAAGRTILIRIVA
jgi:hypothetical protein